jgi:hypothetical protein
MWKSVAKRSVLILTLVISLFFSCYFSYAAKADTLGPLWDRSDELNVDDVVEINSPQNTTYSTNEVLLKVTVTADSSVNDVGYSIDGSVIERIDKLTKVSEIPAYTLLPPNVRVTYTGSVVLTGLAKGSHTITVYHGYQYTGTNKRYEALKRNSVSFTIGTPIDAPPKIKLLSVENKTYDQPAIPLNFMINEPVTQITYSFDGTENVSITGNTTLTGLLNGNHNLILFAEDEAGNIGASDTIYFTVAVPEHFPTVLVATASGASVALIALGLLVYFKKRRQ